MTTLDDNYILVLDQFIVKRTIRAESGSERDGRAVGVGMTKDVNLILNWSSYLIHCLALTTLVLVFVIPYWYVSEESVDGMEIAGLWVRCRVGGSCRPVHDSLDPCEYFFRISLRKSKLDFINISC